MKKSFSNFFKMFLLCIIGCAAFVAMVFLITVIAETPSDMIAAAKTGSFEEIAEPIPEYNSLEIVSKTETIEIEKVAQPAQTSAEPEAELLQIDVEDVILLTEEDVEPDTAGPTDTIEEEPYVLIDLSDQMLYIMQDDMQLLTTPVITGLANSSRATPTGEYSIYSKEADRYLKGPGYNCHVDYFMPFNGGIGIHDASWRSDDEFMAGDTYMESGSHGCINVPCNIMKDVYDYCKVGTIVIVQD